MMTKTKITELATDPGKDCPLCPRLVEFRHEQRTIHPEWHNAPVDTWASAQGDADVRLLIVGLAPGLRGANRTARPFTGDWAGDLLYATLLKFGFANGSYGAEADDGLELNECAITNAVRCVPPENKPTGKEINTCRPFLVNTFERFSNLGTILTLGKIAHDSTARTLGQKLKDVPFAHASSHDMNGYSVISSYHCSRYNTNTGRLTTQMFEEVFGMVRESLNS